MTYKTLLFPLFIALVLTFAVTLANLHAYLPFYAVCFAVALLAAVLSQVLPSVFAAVARARQLANKEQETDRTSAAKTATKKAPGSAAAVKLERGNVKWFSASKGFGFITRDKGGDIFVHFRSINGDGHRQLREGQRVEFAVTTGSKGLQAENVTAIQ